MKTWKYVVSEDFEESYSYSYTSRADSQFLIPIHEPFFHLAFDGLESAILFYNLQQDPSHVISHKLTRIIKMS